MASKNTNTPKRRSKKASVSVFALKVGDIVEYGEDSSSYDLLLKKMRSDEFSVTFKIMCLEDGVQQSMTYYHNEKYWVH